MLIFIVRTVMLLTSFAVSFCLWYVFGTLQTALGWPWGSIALLAITCVIIAGAFRYDKFKENEKIEVLPPDRQSSDRRH